MKKLLLCLSLLWSFLLSAQEGKTLVDAVAMVEAKEYAQAAVLLDSLALTTPENDAVYYYRSICHFAEGQEKESVQCLEKAYAMDPSNDWYKETLANFYLSSGRAAEAETLFRKLQAEAPEKFPEPYVDALLAEAYRLNRDYDAFFSVLNRLVRDAETDDDMKHQALRGVIGNFDSRTLTAILPRLDTLMTNYATSEPTSVHARSYSLQMAAMLEDYPRVIRECEALIALQPDDTEEVVSCLSMIGDSWHELGDAKKAYKAYEDALKLNPGYCPVLNNYAYFLSLQGRRLGKAERMSRKTIEAEPDNATYLDTYGWILFLRGKAAAAKPYFKHAMLHGGRDSAVVLMHFAMVLDKLGEKDLAAYYLNLSKNKNK